MVNSRKSIVTIGGGFAPNKPQEIMGIIDKLKLLTDGYRSFGRYLIQILCHQDGKRFHIV